MSQLSSSLTIADTSAWVEFLRAKGTPVGAVLRRLRTAGELAITEAVAMEVLAGARDLKHERLLRRHLAAAAVLPTGNLEAWEDAARIYRACRRGGATPRSQLDCLIAAIAIREEVPVLHADRDFGLIAEHTPLAIAPV